MEYRRFVKFTKNKINKYHYYGSKPLLYVYNTGILTQTLQQDYRRRYCQCVHALFVKKYNNNKIRSEENIINEIEQPTVTLTAENRIYNKKKNGKKDEGTRGKVSAQGK